MKQSQCNTFPDCRIKQQFLHFCPEPHKERLHMTQHRLPTVPTITQHRLPTAPTITQHRLPTLPTITGDLVIISPDPLKKEKKSHKILLNFTLTLKKKMLLSLANQI